MAVLDSWLTRLPEEIRPFVTIGATLAFAAFLGWATAYVILFILRRIADRPGNGGLVPFERRWRRPVKWITPLLFVNFAASAVAPLDEAIAVPLLRIVSLLIIASVAGFAIRTVQAMEDFVQLRFDVGVRDNLRARKIHTQMRVFERVLIVLIVIIAGALMLMTFDRIRHIGVSIFASAGIAGIVIGLAAQRTLGTMIAGLQIAITQPIRIDDVVIVENEWGIIEEITLTYVVIRIWDLRRLIVPITYFIDHPFQNWTRVSADLLGTIYLYADYGIPLEALRKELRRICESSDLWDGKVSELVVVEAREQNLQLRALISACDSSQAWNLRCLVREKLIEFIQREYPAFLPRFRADLTAGSTGTTAEAAPAAGETIPPSVSPS